ncbi:MAG: hypothetical protein RL367_489 [Pseudomonadota bacterium]
MPVTIRAKTGEDVQPGGTALFGSLESLRSICALVVALFHVTWTNHFLRLPGIDRAWTFVDFFFVLSGFVISNAYLGKINTSGDARDFMIKRLFRLYPLHIVTLIGVGALQFVSWKMLGRADPFGSNWQVLIALNLTLSHAIGLSSGAILNVPSWSISVELYAYMLFCLIGLVGRSPRIRATILALCVAVSLFALVTANPDYGLSTPANTSLARGVFGFSLGCFITVFRQNFVLRVSGWFADAVIAVIAAVIIAMMTLNGEHSHFLFWLPLVFGMFILALTCSHGSRLVAFLEMRIFRQFGMISYSIYMNHVFILMLFSFVAGRIASGPKIVAEHGQLHAIPLLTGDILVAGFIIVLLASSWVTYRLIENPGRSLGRRITKSGLR